MWSNPLPQHIFTCPSSCLDCPSLRDVRYVAIYHRVSRSQESKPGWRTRECRWLWSFWSLERRRSCGDRGQQLDYNEELTSNITTPSFLVFKRPYLLRAINKFVAYLALVSSRIDEKATEVPHLSSCCPDDFTSNLSPLSCTPVHPVHTMMDVVPRLGLSPSVPVGTIHQACARNKTSPYWQIRSIPWPPLTSILFESFASMLVHAPCVRSACRGQKR